MPAQCTQCDSNKQYDLTEQALTSGPHRDRRMFPGGAAAKVLAPNDNGVLRLHLAVLNVPAPLQ